MKNSKGGLGEDVKSYGKISSEAYDIWFPEKEEGYEDTQFYKKIIQEQNGPALEIGCGNGRLLIPYVKEGLDVTGVDLSSYMIQLCQKKAQQLNLSVKFYEQPMQKLEIPRKFSTIYIPYGSFMLVNDQNESASALVNFYKHLDAGGKLVISLFIPTEQDIHVSAPEQNKKRLRREGVRADGAIVKCWEKVRFDTKKQLEHGQYLYEVFIDGKLVATEEEELVLRWYTQEQFHKLLEVAGFTHITCVKGYEEKTAKPSDNEFTFIAVKKE